MSNRVLAGALAVLLLGDLPWLPVGALAGALAGERVLLAQAGQCKSVCTEYSKAWVGLRTYDDRLKAIEDQLKKAKTDDEKDEIKKRTDYHDLLDKRVKLFNRLGKLEEDCPKLVAAAAERPKTTETRAACEECQRKAKAYDEALLAWRQAAALAKAAKQCGAEHLVKDYEADASRKRATSKSRSRDLQACETECLKSKQEEDS